MIVILIKVFSHFILSKVIEHCYLDYFNTFLHGFPQSASVCQMTLRLFLVSPFTSDLLLAIVFAHKLYFQHCTIAVIHIGQAISRPLGQFLINAIVIVVICLWEI